MENVKFIEVETLAGTETHAMIILAEGSFISMLKSTYDAMQAEQAAKASE